MMESFSGLLKLFSVIRSIGPRIWNYLRLKWFRLRDRPPLTSKQAIDFAYAVLDGVVTSAFSFNNYGSNNIGIAVASKNYDGSSIRISYLEQINKTFYVKWQSEDLYGLKEESLSVNDSNKDGFKEITFLISSFGTGAGYNELVVLLTSSLNIYKVEESFSFCNPSKPIYSVQFDYSGINSDLNWLTSLATKNGLLTNTEAVDLDSPAWAVRRWHVENGNCDEGTIKIHRYAGALANEATVTAELQTEKYFWSAHFKSAIYGYNKMANFHFVVYSPSNSYGWINSITHLNDQIWFSTHSDSTIYSFDYASNSLNKFTKYDGEELPLIYSLSVEEGLLFFVTNKNGPKKIIELSRLS